MIQLAKTGLPNHPLWLEFVRNNPNAEFNDSYRIMEAMGMYNVIDYFEKAKYKDFKEKDFTLILDDSIELPLYEISDDTDSIGDYKVFWFVNDLLFYKDKKFIFALNTYDAMKLFSYNSMRVCAYNELMTNKKLEIPDYIFQQGLCSQQYTGPWEPYTLFHTCNHDWYIAHNKIVKEKR